MEVIYITIAGGLIGGIYGYIAWKKQNKNKNK